MTAQADRPGGKASASSTPRLPAGYIRSHRVSWTKKQGLASYAVTTIPAHWASSSEEAKGEVAKANAEAEGGLNGLKGAKGKVAGAKEHAATEKQTQTFSHHALVVDAAVQGAGFLRAGASIELTITAEMVYVGKE